MTGSATACGRRAAARSSPPRTASSGIRAFLREFVAVIVEHRWLNLIACAPFVLFTAFLLWESFQQR